MTNRFESFAHKFFNAGRVLDAAVMFGLGCPEVCSCQDTHSEDYFKKGIRGRAFHWLRPGFSSEEVSRMIGISSAEVVEIPAFNSITVRGFEYINRVKMNSDVKDRLTSAFQAAGKMSALSIVHFACLFEDWMRKHCNSRSSLYGTVLEDFRREGTSAITSGSVDDIILVLECVGTARENVAHNSKFSTARATADIKEIMQMDGFKELVRTVVGYYERR